jgi:hypothetical protein
MAFRSPLVEQKAVNLLRMQDLPASRSDVESATASIQSRCEVLEASLRTLLRAVDAGLLHAPRPQQQEAFSDPVFAQWSACKSTLVDRIHSCLQSVHHEPDDGAVAKHIAACRTLVIAMRPIGVLLLCADGGVRATQEDLRHARDKVARLRTSIQRVDDAMTKLKPRQGAIRAQSNVRANADQRKLKELQDQRRDIESDIQRIENNICTLFQRSLSGVSVHVEGNGAPTSLPAIFKQLEDDTRSLVFRLGEREVDIHTDFPDAVAAAQDKVTREAAQAYAEQVRAASMTLETYLSQQLAEHARSYREALDKAHALDETKIAQGERLTPNEFISLAQALYCDSQLSLGSLVRRMRVAHAAQQSVPSDFFVLMDAAEQMCNDCRVHLEQQRNLAQRSWQQYENSASARAFGYDQVLPRSAERRSDKEYKEFAQHYIKFLILQTKESHLQLLMNFSQFWAPIKALLRRCGYSPKPRRSAGH